MNIRNIFKTKRQKTSQALQDYILSNSKGYDYYGNWSNANALKNSDIFTAIHVLSSSIATARIEKFLDGRPYDDSITNLFNSQPNDFMNGYDFKYIIAANMLLNGQSFVRIVFDEEGDVEALVFLHNSNVSIEEKGHKVIYKINSDNFNGNLESHEILHFKYMTLDGFNCFSPLHSLVREIDISEGSKKFLSNFFNKGASFGGILKINFAKLSDEEKEAMKKDFEDMNMGSGNSGGIAVIDPASEYQQLKIPTEVLSFLNSYTFTTKQIAKAFNIPIDRLGGENQHTSLSDSNNVYITDTLVPFFTTITSEIEFKLYDTTITVFKLAVKFNYQYLFDSDITLKINNNRSLVASGIITINEARKALGFERLQDEPNADKILIQSANVALDNIATIVNNKGGD